RVEGRRPAAPGAPPSAPVPRRRARPVRSLRAGPADVAQTRDLQDYGVAFVVLVGSTDPAVERRLDGTPGLVRVSSASTASLWRVVPPGVRVQVRNPPAAPQTVPGDPDSEATQVDASAPA